MHDLVQPYVDAGLVTARTHPTLPLTIYNYSDECVYSRKWDDVTRMCRGLILDGDGGVVARPFAKFFNYEEHLQFPELGAIPNEPFVAYDKMDGSLIIVVNYEGERVVSSRGSFESDQALWATQILDEMRAGIPPKGFTFIHELIHPENRIVVNYGDRTELVHIGTTLTETGEDAPSWDSVFCHCVFDHPDRWTFADDHTQLPVRENAEGYVLRFDSGLRVKVKFEEYVRLHKLVFGINHNVVFRAVRDGEYQDLTRDVPEEFREWMDELATHLNSEYDKLHYRAYDTLLNIKEALPDDFVRRDFALMAMETDIPDLLFASLDSNRDKLSACIWKRIERSMKESLA